MGIENEIIPTYGLENVGGGSQMMKFVVEKSLCFLCCFVLWVFLLGDGDGVCFNFHITPIVR